MISLRRKTISGKIILNTLEFNGKEIRYDAFITSYHIRFHSLIEGLTPEVKHIIKNSKELNDMYDCFLDFIIDSKRII
jgi:hypothetical protein